MNQLIFISRIKELELFEITKVGDFFVEVTLKGTDYCYKYGCRPGWKRKVSQESHIDVSMSEVLETCNEEVRGKLINNAELFTKRSGIPSYTASKNYDFSKLRPLW